MVNFEEWLKTKGRKQSTTRLYLYQDTITELKAMISSLKLTIDALRQTISSQNTTIASLQESMDRLQCAYDKAVKERDDLSNRMNR